MGLFSVCKIEQPSMPLPAYLSCAYSLNVHLAVSRALMASWGGNGHPLAKSYPMRPNFLKTPEGREPERNWLTEDLVDLSEKENARCAEVQSGLVKWNIVSKLWPAARTRSKPSGI